jgi:vacuolar-type H+-ATPase subunit I/STV1
MIRIIAQVPEKFDPSEEMEEISQPEMPKNIPLADEEEVPEGEKSLDDEIDKAFTKEPEIIQEPEVVPGTDEVLPEPEPKEIPEIKKEEEPLFPEQEYEEITEELTKLDEMNRDLTIPEKIDRAMAEGYPLRIIYTTLKGHTTERTVIPDYYLPARTTGNWVLIAWCELRNDWRGFIVDRIRGAKLEAKNE